MSTNWLIDSTLILIGAAALVWSFFNVSRIIKELGTGNLKKRWSILRWLVVLFIFGYIGYWYSLPHDAGIESLIVSLIFIFGSLFVVTVSWLMLQTTRDVKRVANLELQSITDPLLGIYNRRYLDQRLSEEIARAQRYKFPLSLLMLDVDHFKQVNDQFGHLTGDSVLVGIAKVLQDNIRESDMAARYGGEELVLVLPNTAEDKGMILAERLRGLLEKQVYTSENGVHKFRCTVSIGVIALGQENGSPTEFIHKADVALYQAKRTGRNRVVAFKEEYESNYRET